MDGMSEAHSGIFNSSYINVYHSIIEAVLGITK